MGNKFIWENGSVFFYFNKIDGHGWDLSKDGSTEGVGEGKVYIGEGEVDMVGGGLETACQSYYAYMQVG